MNRELFAEKLSELPVYIYDFFDPRELEFSERIRWICQTECPKYGTTWACPPGVGTVPECREKCLSYSQCLLISSIAEVEDISDIDETLATRPSHEELTEQVAALLRDQGEQPYILSTQACAICWMVNPAATRRRCTPAWRATASMWCPFWSGWAWNSSSAAT